MDLSKSGIYEIRNKVNNKVYIGSTIKFSARWLIHKSHLRNKKHHSKTLQEDWEEFGKENFKFSIIEYVTKGILLQREQYWMDETKCYEREFGYNVLRFANSPSGYKHTEESKSKISKANKGRKWSKESKKRLSESCKGRKISDATKRKISEFSKGRKHPPRSKEARLKISKTRKAGYASGKIKKVHLGQKFSKEHKRKISENHADFSGNKNGRARLTWEKVREIREKHKNGIAQSKLAIEYGVGKTTIGHIVHYRSWQEKK